MLYTYEFEIYKSEQFYLASPFDLEVGTQGMSFGEACELAADWLKMEIESYLMRHLEVPKSNFGHEPQHGGKIVIVAVEASIDTIRKVPASKAAEMLGVSRGRVSQMCAKAQLESFKDGGITWVTLDSIETRLAERPKAGRPKKKFAIA